MADVADSAVPGYKQTPLEKGPFPVDFALVCQVCWAMVPLNAEAAGRHLGWHEDRGEL